MGDLLFVVTGCAGVIGSHVAKRLLERGDRVIGIDNLNDYYDVRLKERNITALSKYHNFEFHREDIRDREAVERVINGEDVYSIIHIAALVGVRASVVDPSSYYETNVMGSLNLLECARSVRLSNFVIASSSSVYGDIPEMPLSELDRTDKPISPYAASKKCCEVTCYTYSLVYGLPVTCLRFFTVYGPGGRPDMAPFKFLDAVHREEPILVYGDGSSERDYTYVDDIVSGVVAAAANPFDFEIINLGNAEPVTLNNFIATVEEVVGKKARRVVKPKQVGDVMRTCADINKARRLLDYKPGTSLFDGLVATYQWYLREIAGR